MAVTLTPTAQTLLDKLNRSFPALGTRINDADEARRLFAMLRKPSESPTPVAAIEDFQVPGSDGNRLRVRRYGPEAIASDAAVVFFHGGGWVLGSLDSHDELVRKLANASGCEFFSVDYRLAPQHRYPAAHDDAYSAFDALSEKVQDRPIIVAGDSAGANLATSICLRARDLSARQPDGQVLIYPMLDPRCSTKSMREFSHGYYITADHLDWFWRQYLWDPSNPSGYAAPIDLAVSGLAHAHVVTAELDPLRDEGERYAEKLHGEGVPVTLRRYPGAFHGFLAFDTQLEIAATAIKEIGGRIREIGGPVAT